MGYGFHQAAIIRSNPLRKLDPTNQLPQRVYQIWHLTPEETTALGEPLATQLSDIIPEAWLQTVARVTPGVQVVGVLAAIIQQRQQAEQQIIAQFREWQVAASSNGAVPPSQSTDIPEELDPARMMHNDAANIDQREGA